MYRDEITDFIYYTKAVRSSFISALNLSEIYCGWVKEPQETNCLPITDEFLFCTFRIWKSSFASSVDAATIVNSRTANIVPSSERRPPSSWKASNSRTQIRASFRYWARCWATFQACSIRFGKY